MRRLAALIALVAVIALALTLLYRVYLHHSRTEPYLEEREGAVVRLDEEAASHVKFAMFTH